MYHLYFDHISAGYFLKGLKVYVSPITWKRVAFKLAVSQK